MLLLALTLLVAVPPIIAAGLLLVQSILLWQRRRSVRADVTGAVAEINAEMEKLAKTLASDKDRYQSQSGLPSDFQAIWWRSPFDFVTLDDYLTDVEVQSAIDQLVRRIAAQRAPNRSHGLTHRTLLPHPPAR